MSDDLKPRSHVFSLIGTAIAVGTTVWGASAWLNNRADKAAVEKIVNDSFMQRLDMETMKGEMKSIHIQLDLKGQIEKGFDSVNARLDRKERRER